MTLPELFAARKQDVIEQVQEANELISNFFDRPDYRFLKGNLFVDIVVKTLGNGCRKSLNFGYDAKYGPYLISIKSTKEPIFSRPKLRGVGYKKPHGIMLVNQLRGKKKKISMKVNFDYLIAIQTPTQEEQRLVVGLVDYAQATKHQVQRSDQTLVIIYDWIDKIEVTMPPPPIRSSYDIDDLHDAETEMTWELLKSFKDKNKCIPYTMKTA